ncbi:Transcriptional regulatory protein AfsQ1 [Methyloligella halotolerans]|uniref:histidine kinase n=1 Tax=Methyloligella halotolerans TaxID=1177755 RepID=A0A1E2RXW0_9HYPH|nr:response regulator [Methyloligella halotolerans]ODA66945.1 Transcriptional regulatory protein AfsQ1 [Methyloligella halotolerans]
MGEERLRILYIDDDPGLRRLVQRELERQGCEVHTEPDGESGIAKLKEHSFDAVALDHLMPGMDGLETLEHIRSTISHLPVVFVTAAAESRIAVAALKAGAADYVVKDVEGHFIVLIKVAVESAIAAHAMRQAKEAAEQEVREARDRFEALASERAVLLREVNHRVSNSLQLIASMLQIQAANSDSEETRETLKNAVARVLAVAEVHKRLYTSEGVESVAVDQYLRELVEDLRRSAEDEGLSQLSFQAAPLYLDPDRAVALGVIVNELIINAWKYAYPDSNGPIRIGLSRTPDGLIVLSVEDDGVGWSGETPQTSTGLGQKIVRAMAQKLGASVEYAPKDRGTRVLVSFQERDAHDTSAAA